jgi:hypothetical protein
VRQQAEPQQPQTNPARALAVLVAIVEEFGVARGTQVTMMAQMGCAVGGKRDQHRNAQNHADHPVSGLAAKGQVVQGLMLELGGVREHRAQQHDAGDDRHPAAVRHQDYAATHQDGAEHQLHAEPPSLDGGGKLLDLVPLPNKRC